MKSQRVLSLLAVVGIVGGAASAGVLQIDVNALSGQSFDAFNVAGAFGGLTHTGSIHLSGNALSSVADVLLNGMAQNIAAGQFSSFTGVIDLVNGGVIGGSFTLILTNADTFTANIVNGTGQVQLQAGQGYSIDGLLTSALFSGSTFGGANITPWYSQQPLNGSFLNFAFNPNASGADGQTDVDIFVVIPSPMAGGMASAGLLGLAARRRRG